MVGWVHWEEFIRIRSYNISEEHYRNPPEKSEETHDKTGHDSRCYVQDSNWSPAEYESVALPHQSPRRLQPRTSITKPQFCLSSTGVKLSLSRYWKKTDWGCLKTGCWGRYLEIRGRKKQDSGRDYIMRSSTMCYSLTNIIRLSNQ